MPVQRMSMPVKSQHKKQDKVSLETYKTLQAIMATGLIETLCHTQECASAIGSVDPTASTVSGDVAVLPPDTPTRVIAHAGHAARFRRLKVYLLREIAACSDLSLISGGNNQNIIQTIDQIIGIETAELQKVLDDGLNYGLPASSSSSSSSAISGTNELNSAISDAPRGYICPITLGLMRFPVIAADGNSYERSAIEKWFTDGNHSSPITNLPMDHQNLIANRALQTAIDEFKNSQHSSGVDASDEAASAGKRGRKRKAVKFQ